MIIREMQHISLQKWHEEHLEKELHLSFLINYILVYEIYLITQHKLALMIKKYFKVVKKRDEREKKRDLVIQ